MTLFAYVPEDRDDNVTEWRWYFNTDSGRFEDRHKISQKNNGWSIFALACWAQGRALFIPKLDITSGGTKKLNFEVPQNGYAVIGRGEVRRHLLIRIIGVQELRRYHPEDATAEQVFQAATDNREALHLPDFGAMFVQTSEGRISRVAVLSNYL